MKAIIIIISILLLLVVAVVIYMHQPQFGKVPSGERLKRMEDSPNYRDGKFQNLSKTPQLAEGYNYFSVIYDFLFSKVKRTPDGKIPGMKTNLHTLPPDEDVVIWFGHSSYFLQIGGKKILVDPVFSGGASPIAKSNRSFEGTDLYTTDDLPYIDYLLISHDHYDHLDYKTIVKIRDKVGQVVCGLGVGSHFEYWGYNNKKIIEKDWYDSLELEEEMKIYVTPARHFSGRSLATNNTLWVSYVFETPEYQLFIGGDSGYDEHFKSIGKKYGPFDIVFLENGQYNEAWRYIHTLPEETLKAAKDLKAKSLFPLHWSKFALGNHKWDEPIRQITELNQEHPIPLITPLIGEVVNLKDTARVFDRWWETFNEVELKNEG